jgi:hypothetical protein
MFLTGKQLLASAQAARQRADLARIRFEARTRRLASESDAQPDKAVDSAALDALLARTRQRSSGKPD